MKRRRPTHPVLAAVITLLIAVFAANLVAWMFFEGTPDFYALPVEYGLPFLFAAMTYLSHRHRESSSPAPHECPTCRYNLTGNTSGICPECGNSISTSSASPATLPPTSLRHP
ncbi:MAG TPA: hypothetical protein VIM11_03560 [Tepidisphaeraceae bacterium]